MILQEDTSRHQSNLSEVVHTGAYNSSSKEHAWDINDSVLPKDIVPEDFKEWPNGHCKHVYREECEEARKHTSSWAMRNTNNHNVNILKKSCLGVLVCSARCSLENGDGIHLRPAICDKARRKQLGKPCPNVRCTGRLELLACRGHGGYPVTHFWRHIHGLIFFQAKGDHDHPSPEAKSSAEARRQRYAVKENRAAMISRNKDRKRALLQDTAPALPIKPEPSAACDPFSHVPKVRRVCSTCLPYACHCGEAITSYNSSDPPPSPAMHELKPGKDAAAGDGYSVYQTANFYYTDQYNYYYDEKAANGQYQATNFDPAQLTNYAYHNISPEAIHAQIHDVPTTTDSHNQYYMDNGYKDGPPYPPPCMYDPQFLDYRSTEGESIPMSTTTNSIVTYHNHDAQLSPSVGDTFIHLQRPNSCHVTPNTSQSTGSPDTLAHPDIHGNRSPYQQSESPPSHSQTYLVNDSTISNDPPVVTDVKSYSTVPVSNRAFQLPAIVAAVGNPEHCESYSTLAGNSPQQDYTQQFHS